jgi:hypothetical protein
MPWRQFANGAKATVDHHPQLFPGTTPAKRWVARTHLVIVLFYDTFWCPVNKCATGVEKFELAEQMSINVK